MECPEFSDMFLKIVDQYRPSQERPLTLIAYTDSVSPGNVLARNQTRKVEVLYWSIKQLGDLALSAEKNWFLASVARTEHVKRLPGKCSQFFREALERFFQPFDIRHGIQITFGPSGVKRIVFMDLEIIVADEVALKDTLDMKGASGTVLCPLCRNLCDHKSELHRQGGDGCIA